eukprot:SAG11_NODE_2770_length_2990_cov_7.803250_4_plen_174_part_00
MAVLHEASLPELRQLKARLLGVKKLSREPHKVKIKLEQHSFCGWHPLCYPKMRPQRQLTGNAAHLQVQMTCEAIQGGITTKLARRKAGREGMKRSVAKALVMQRALAALATTQTWISKVEESEKLYGTSEVVFSDSDEDDGEESDWKASASNRHSKRQLMIEQLEVRETAART